MSSKASTSTISPPTNPTSGLPQTASITAASSFYSSPIQSETYTCWNADTGASSHMTPHCHWLRNYKLHCIEISLADGSVIYSEGIGSVQFEPVINGRTMQIMEFSNILCPLTSEQPPLSPLPHHVSKFLY